MGFEKEWKCKCGKKKLIHVPYVRTYKEYPWAERVMDLAEIADIAEATNNMMKHVIDRAKLCGADFVDGSTMSGFYCQCGEWIGMNEVISKIQV